MSDGAPSSCENAFDSEFPMGTIKRKPSMKPSLPLTSITRQLKEVGETRDEVDATHLPSSPISYTNTGRKRIFLSRFCFILLVRLFLGTLTRRHSRRKSSNSTDDSSNSGTLKRQHSYKTSRGSLESMGNRSGNSTPLCGTPVRERTSPFGERDSRGSPYVERPPSAGSIRSPPGMDMPSCMVSTIRDHNMPVYVHGTFVTTYARSTYDLIRAAAPFFGIALFFGAKFRVINVTKLFFFFVQTDSVSSLPPPPPPETVGDLIITDPSAYQLPPPPPEIYNSNLSLDSLPPPPNPNELPPLTGADLTGSQLSLMSLPPPPGETATDKRKTLLDNLSLDRTPTRGMSPDQTPTHSRLNTPCFSPPPLSIGSNCSTPTQSHTPVSFSPTHHDRGQQQQQQPPTYVNPPQYRQQSGTLPAFNNNNGLRSSMRQTSLPRQVSVNSISSSNSSNSSGSSVYAVAPYITELQAKNSPNAQRKVNFQEPASPKKNTKKITFNLTPQEAPALPKKPPPPRRSENTKLSSPKKLAEPPKDFLKDLQRVMRKKWQVAQKCKLEPSTTPHEVLGFRDPPVMLPDYKETNVSNWVQEHYGPNNFYENLYRDNRENVAEYATSPVHVRSDAVKCKRPPPPPPKRSETTQLTTHKLH